MEIETFKIEDAKRFLQVRDDKANQYEKDYPLDQEQKRAEFQGEILKLLKVKDGFQLLGDISYRLQPGQKDRTIDWRARDINRLLTRYQQDRPIEDARRLAEDAQSQAKNADRWAKRAIVIALVAFATALVSAVNDAPGAWANLKWVWYEGNQTVRVIGGVVVVVGAGWGTIKIGLLTVLGVQGYIRDSRIEIQGADQSARKQ